MDTHVTRRKEKMTHLGVLLVVLKVGYHHQPIVHDQHRHEMAHQNSSPREVEYHHDEHIDKGDDRHRRHRTLNLFLTVPEQDT